MKKRNVLNLIKYFVDKNELNFRLEAMEVAKSFDDMGDYELSEYIRALLSNTNTFVPQVDEHSNDFFEEVVLNEDILPLPKVISEDIFGVINAINRKISVNKFMFEGRPGTGKTESVKQIARILERKLFMINFSNLIDSKLGQTSKNIVEVFDEINKLKNPELVIILFDEIDAIALDRVNSNDLREMGRVTSTILKELDKLNDDIVLFATTNLYSKIDDALIRRFDAVINFDRYNMEDIEEIAVSILNEYLKKAPEISKNIRIFKKIINLIDPLIYPGDLKNLIRSTLAFSSNIDENDFYKKLYLKITKDNEIDERKLKDEGFTLREMEVLTDKSRSSISRELRGEN